MADSLDFTPQSRRTGGFIPHNHLTLHATALPFVEFVREYSPCGSSRHIARGLSSTDRMILTYGALLLLAMPTVAAGECCDFTKPITGCAHYFVALLVMLSISAALPIFGIAMGVSAAGWVCIHDKPASSLWEHPASVELFVCWAVTTFTFAMMHCIRLHRRRGRAWASGHTWTPVEAYMPLTLLGSVVCLCVLANFWPHTTANPKVFLAVCLPPAISLSSLFWALFGSRWSSCADDEQASTAVQLGSLVA